VAHAAAEAGPLRFARFARERLAPRTPTVLQTAFRNKQGHCGKRAGPSACGLQFEMSNLFRRKSPLEDVFFARYLEFRGPASARSISLLVPLLERDIFPPGNFPAPRDGCGFDDPNLPERFFGGDPERTNSAMLLCHVFLLAQRVRASLASALPRRWTSAREEVPGENFPGDFHGPFDQSRIRFFQF